MGRFEVREGLQSQGRQRRVGELLHLLGLRNRLHRSGQMCCTVGLGLFTQTLCESILYVSRYRRLRGDMCIYGGEV